MKVVDQTQEEQQDLSPDLTVDQHSDVFTLHEDESGFCLLCLHRFIVRDTAGTFSPRSFVFGLFIYITTVVLYVYFDYVIK